MPKQDETERLVCPHHGEEIVYLVDTADTEDEDHEWVECLRCEEFFPNILKYPVQQVHNRTTGETYMKNMITGEVVQDGS